MNKQEMVGYNGSPKKHDTLLRLAHISWQAKDIQNTTSPTVPYGFPMVPLHPLAPALS